ncbi:ArsR/SmtB family transcription factor [Streptomyces reniochalinae]|uniref:ArsR family transcriptional regulator n=1 Tax=Streptomyces reniochalinae TaxID=2250578 RepID=A0A367E7G4_9ACTN|nr:ArsR family transcriptional regulator [Streptomyces reniochalinae]RCG13699.1 ArsR family transcriptional regulator [Streptomyces reniochalinae]
MSAIETPTGDELLRILAALGNPHRMRILAALAEGRNYVSRLAREIGMSRPLLHMHLQRLEAAGLVVGSLELSDSGKAMKFFEVSPFAYALTPQVVAEAARTLTDQAAKSADERQEAGPEPDEQVSDEKERAT